MSFLKFKTNEQPQDKPVIESKSAPLQTVTSEIEQAPDSGQSIQTSASQESVDFYDLSMAMINRIDQFSKCEGCEEHITVKHPALLAEMEQAMKVCELDLNPHNMERVEGAFRKAIETFFRDNAPEPCRGCWANAGKMCYRDVKGKQAQPEACPHKAQHGKRKR